MHVWALQTRTFEGTALPRPCSTLESSPRAGQFVPQHVVNRARSLGTRNEALVCCSRPPSSFPAGDVHLEGPLKLQRWGLHTNTDYIVIASGREGVKGRAANRIEPDMTFASFKKSEQALTILRLSLYFDKSIVNRRTEQQRHEWVALLPTFVLPNVSVVVLQEGMTYACRTNGNNCRNLGTSSFFNMDARRT